MKIFTAICGLMLIASLETGAKVQSNQSAAGLNDVNTERISPVNDSERLDRLEALVEERVSYTPQIHGVVRARWEGSSAMTTSRFDIGFRCGTHVCLSRGMCFPR